MNKSRS